jgi:hypothetical protein
VSPVVVYLPSTGGRVTHQVFPINIQRQSRCLISAWNKGRDPVHLSIDVYDEYEEKYEGEFIAKGFEGRKRPPEPLAKGDEIQTTKNSTNIVWDLPRGSYYVVVTAKIPEQAFQVPGFSDPAIDAVYEIGIATSPQDFKIPDIPIASGIITNPQVPAESAVYLPKHRYAPMKLEPGIPQFRLTQIKGSHELFGIIVPTAGWFADITFEVRMLYDNVYICKDG